MIVTLVNISNCIPIVLPMINQHTYTALPGSYIYIYYNIYMEEAFSIEIHLISLYTLY